jgi:hypothetical protein
MGSSGSFIFQILLVSGVLMAICNVLLLLKVGDSHTHQQPTNEAALYDYLNVSASTCQVLHTAKDIRRCYPSEMIRKLPENCWSVATWDDLQRCLTGRFVPLPTQYNYTVHIIGERNSGTKWLQQELQQCFPRNRVNFKIRRDFIRSKHFFQPIQRRDHTKSIIVSLFRNPVDWVAAMREAPYHSPRHTRGFDNITERPVPMPWQEFVSTVWATQRTAFDLQLIQQNRIQETLKGDTCSEHFALYEVVPCRYNLSSDDNDIHRIPAQRFRGYEPVYELRRDHTGRPFTNILELRRDKIVNFALEIPLLTRLGGYAAVRYEDLLRNGTRFLLEQVADILGLDDLPATCRPSPPQPDRLGKRVIDSDFRKYVEEYVAASASERLLGYL